MAKESILVVDDEREILELVKEPEEVVARAGGPDRPARFWGLALLADDLEETVRQLGEHAGEIRDAVQPGRRIATVQMCIRDSLRSARGAARP